MPRDELRSRFGMVLQDAWLFTGTIRENIEYGRPGASDAEIFAAAQASHVDQFVRALPGGYATVLGNDGDSLSRGQRQLISIARAQLAGPQHPHPGRGDQLGGQPHRSADPAGDAAAPAGQDQLRDCPPLVHRAGR